MPGTPDDMTIITSVLGGDTDAYEHLLERHAHTVAKIASAHVPGDHVEEVAHEVFIRAFRSLESYKPTSPFGNWLTTITVRTCHDFWRDHYRRREAPASDLSKDGLQFIENALASDSMDAFESASRQREARELLSVLLDTLSPMDRTVLTLTYLEELSVSETAALLGISAPNVKVRSFRAKRKLKQFMKRHGIHGGIA